jgi:hypothetical protein
MITPVLARFPLYYYLLDAEEGGRCARLPKGKLALLAGCLSDGVDSELTRRAPRKSPMVLRWTRPKRGSMLNNTTGFDSSQIKVLSPSLGMASLCFFACVWVADSAPFCWILPR